MFKIIQEAALPKLSQTSLYDKFNETSNISISVRDELKRAKNYIVKPESIEETLALMKLNGDTLSKKAIEAFKRGDIVIIDNKETSKIPSCLPYIIINNGESSKAYIFANVFLDVITSPQEYTKLMAVMEAAYLALGLTRKPNVFLLNSNLMLTLCKIYTLMISAPLQQKLYMKGENLNKALIYIIAYFYRLFKDVNEIDVKTVPYHRIMDDKIDTKLAETIINDVKSMNDLNFMTLIEKIKKINTLRYEELDSMYMSYFTSVCGSSVIFAIENISYLFLLLTSSEYKTNLTGMGLNKLIGYDAKKIISLMSGNVK